MRSCPPLHDLSDQYDRLKSGDCGNLIAVSKLFDGITDVFFGSMIDKTRSRMGKARPWMLYGYIAVPLP